MQANQHGPARSAAAADAVLTNDEAAAYLRSHPSFLAKLRVYGGGPEYIKIGRSVRYKQSALDRWLEGKVRRSTSQEAGA